jgi:hypothetical protein
MPATFRCPEVKFFAHGEDGSYHEKSEPFSFHLPSLSNIHHRPLYRPRICRLRLLQWNILPRKPPFPLHSGAPSKGLGRKATAAVQYRRLILPPAHRPMLHHRLLLLRSHILLRPWIRLQRRSLMLPHRRVSPFSNPTHIVSFLTNQQIPQRHRLILPHAMGNRHLPLHHLHRSLHLLEHPLPDQLPNHHLPQPRRHLHLHHLGNHHHHPNPRQALCHYPPPTPFNTFAQPSSRNPRPNTPLRYPRPSPPRRRPPPKTRRDHLRNMGPHLTHNKLRIHHRPQRPHLGDYHRR